MYDRKWYELRKIKDAYELEPESTKTRCLTRINFNQLAFDEDEERLAAIDTAGYMYNIDLTNSYPTYQKLGNVGQSTFVAFNPVDKSEVLVGLTTAAIKIIKINENVVQFCLLIAHEIPPTHISFYKNYCLSCSRKEVIIWDLCSCSKAHQLKVNTKNIIVKKTSFSNLGHIVALYHNDTIQAWIFKQLEKDTKIDATNFGIRNIKDFVFTKNGRAMIMASTQNKIVVLNTCNWSLLKRLNLPDTFIGVKQLSVVPSELDGGANKILAVISSNCTLHFFDINSSCFVDMVETIKTIKKITVSSNGRYIAYIEVEGKLRIMYSEKLFFEKCDEPQKLKEPCRPIAHGIGEHLQCVRSSMEQELRLERLIPILKEFGEYPEKYRTIIWSTILKLPANKNAYSTLANKASCTNFTSDLLKRYPLANRSKQTLLQNTINCLIQWCPMLVQCTFLPNFIFPFLMVFQKDLLLAFELILTILLNYCQKWFEYHPLPPLNVLGIIENVLLEADPSLLNVFCERGITSSEYAWPLLKTAMSEVLSGSEWLILWDHLISYQKPLLLMICVVAYNICCREIIISLLNSPEIVEKFYSTQGQVRAKDILKVAERLDKEMVARVHPNRYLRNHMITLSSKGPYQPFLLQDYPKYLTDNFSLSKLKELKEQEATRERNRKAAEIAEKERLRRETEIFMNQIHQERLNEVQNCIRKQSYDIARELDEETYRIPEDRTSRLRPDDSSLDIDIRSDNDSGVLKDEKSKSCEQLRRDVDQLEYEVQSLLESLRSRRSGAEIT